MYLFLKLLGDTDAGRLAVMAFCDAILIMIAAAVYFYG